MSTPKLPLTDLTQHAAYLIRFFHSCPSCSNKYVYRLEDLPLVGTSSPCKTSNSRFVRKDAGNDGSGCTGDSSIAFPEVAAAIVTYLNDRTLAEQESKRVIDLSTWLGCTDTHDAALGGSFTVTIPGSGEKSCWEHSYRREWSVFVMNNWAVNHPGNYVKFANSEPNPIARVAEQEDTGNAEDRITLKFPPMSWHEWNFENNYWTFEKDLVGSWGDKIAFNDLPDSAKSADVVADLGGTVLAESGELCGSKWMAISKEAKETMTKEYRKSSKFYFMTNLLQHSVTQATHFQHTSSLHSILECPQNRRRRRLSSLTMLPEC